VAVGPGSVGVVQQIITGLCDAVEEVAFAWRSVEAYPILVELAGARPVRIPPDDAEGHDLDAMAVAVTGRTKVILLCTPNNPTGLPTSHDRLDAFLQTDRSDVLVVIDEAYVEYADTGSGPDSLALGRRYPNVCILRTFSKAYGLAGLRFGYAIMTAAIAEGLRRTDLPFAVSALAQKGGHRVAGRGGGDGSAGFPREGGVRPDGCRAGGRGLDAAAEVAFPEYATIRRRRWPPVPGRGRAIGRSDLPAACRHCPPPPHRAGCGRGGNLGGAGPGVQHVGDVLTQRRPAGFLPEDLPFRRTRIRGADVHQAGLVHRAAGVRARGNAVRADDLRRPAVPRTGLALADAGAQVLLVCSSWVPGRARDRALACPACGTAPAAVDE
jgi:hypothetical protein